MPPTPEKVIWAAVAALIATHAMGAPTITFVRQLRPPPDINLTVRDLNNNGSMVGGYSDGSGWGPFMWWWRDGQFVDDYPGGPRGELIRINDREQVVAYDYYNGGTFFDGEVLQYPPFGPGPLSNEYLVGVDDEGIKLWDLDTWRIQNLGTYGLRCRISAVNNFGVVVGSAEVGPNQWHAIMADAVNGVRDLNDLLPPESEWLLFEANDINDSGVIVGRGSYASGSIHAIMFRDGEVTSLSHASYNPSAVAINNSGCVVLDDPPMKLWIDGVAYLPNDLLDDDTHTIGNIVAINDRNCFVNTSEEVFEIHLDCPADLNLDGVIGQADLGILLAAYAVDDGGDIDGDGDTDQADLGKLLSVYGDDCP